MNPMGPSNVITFHPLTDIPMATLGGSLLSVATILYYVTTGRALGISGILEGFVVGDPISSLRYKIAFMGGFFHAILLMAYLFGETFSSATDPHLDSLSPALLLLSGILVGFGSRLARGCTSGHGVVGLPRRSPRSFVFVVTMMLSAFAVANISAIFIGHASHSPSIEMLATPAHMLDAVAVIGTLFVAFALASQPSLFLDSAVSYLSGAVFSIGLTVSGMTHPMKVMNFLKFGPNWDPSLAFVLGSTFLLNSVFFVVAQKHLGEPLLSKVVPDESHAFAEIPLQVDLRLLLGGVVFGAGWGIGGVCPGPAIAQAASGNYSQAAFLPAMMMGMFLGAQATKVDRYLIEALHHPTKRSVAGKN